ncbi:choice-of-anchor L domain-containing protein [Marinifilum fragile]|uniref:choice-of-anchor L domain-containing protein n=1 Tax=Marinifilum fragile TaxID=570161 RepID=UPI0006D05163|nr:choice-of-anchor L domain-containing protein [Marinifilum fragile]
MHTFFSRALLLVLFCFVTNTISAQSYPKISISIDKTRILKDGGEATVTVSLSKRSLRRRPASISLSYNTNGTGSSGYDFTIDPPVYYHEFQGNETSFSFKIKGVYQIWGSSNVDLKIAITSRQNCVAEGEQEVNLNISNDLGYCTSSGINYDIGITSVAFNEINEASSAYPIYTDNLGVASDVNKGSSYGLVVKLNSAGRNRIYARAWIDWNQNKLFEDVEMYNLGFVWNESNGATSNSPYSIAVPNDAVFGTTRMRVSAKYDNYPESCETGFYGEVEDYTLNILPKFPIVSLTTGSSMVDENGESVSIIASLDEVSVNDITVNLGFTGSAPSADYNCPNTIVVPAGSLSKTVILTAINNNTNDGDRDVIIDVIGVINANENGTQQQTITIVDDDKPSTAPIKINTQDVSIGTSPEDLVQNVLVTGCLTANSITFNGDQAQGIGYFEKGDSDFPLSSGVIMSTGNVENAIGPASRSGRDAIGGFDFDEGSQDSDLMFLADTKPRFNWWGSIVGWDRKYFDAQILEFDFVPAGNKLEFNYIFASEEYNGYACTDYNDGFAFIISGPGISNDTGLSGKNIALTESGDQVSINNVYKNQCPSCPDNSSLYVEEIGGYPIAFDGRTKILKARADVKACETYHIKLIVYDRNDQDYNSAVFLEAKSFKSNEVTVENKLDGLDGDKSVMYRGCDKSYISFSRKENLDEEYTFHVNISGTAVNGVDYFEVTEDGTKIGNFPEDVTFASGQSDIKIYYMASNEVSGAKDILFEVLRGCPCSTDASDYFRKKIDILDVGEIKANAISNVTCGGGAAISTIIIELKDGLDPVNYLYSLDGGAFQEENKFQGAYTVGAHTVTIKDKFSCSSKDVAINIPLPTDLKANAGADFEMCEKETSRTLNGTGGIVYEWTCDKAIGLTNMDLNSENPTISPNVPAGVYIYTLTVSDGVGKACESSDDVVVTVKPTPVINSLVANKTEVCSEAEISLTANVSNAINPTYNWSPSSEITGAGLSVKAVPVTNVLTSRTYTFEVVSNNNCSASQSVSGIQVNPNPIVSLKTAESNLCSDGTDGEIKVEASGGTPRITGAEYDYLWSHDAGLNIDHVTGLAPQTYTVTVRDYKSCQTSIDVQVKTEPKPIGIFY